MPNNEYNTTFETEVTDQKKLLKAFDQVSDIRKFEISLYWTRATYFWTLIAVAFAGYFAIFSADDFDQKYFISLIVASVGFVFTFAWYLANRGSKYWQENWENHLDLLEDNVTGPLYKTVLERPKSSSVTERLITGPLSVSVSKINQWVSVYVMSIWFILMALSLIKSAYGNTLPSILAEREQYFTLFVHAAVVVGAIGCCAAMFLAGRTHKGSHEPLISRRITRISGHTRSP